MSEDKIIISFDNEKPRKKEDKILIDLDEKIKVPAKDIDDKNELKEKVQIKGNTAKEKISSEINTKELKINSNFRENPALTGFSSSDMSFPSGVENGFGETFTSNIKDVFLNSLLVNNLYLIASSKSGNVYFIDRNDGEIFDKIFFENESFEKTGFIFQNISYINSLKSIYKFERTESNGNITKQIIYTSGDENFIWSNLNYYDGNIAFVEYSPATKIAFLKIIDIDKHKIKYEYKFEVKNNIYDSVIIGNKTFFVLFDNKILIIDLSNQTNKIVNINFNASPDLFILYLNHKLYFNNTEDDLLYLDMEHFTGKVKFSGISSSIINSLSGIGENIVIGNSNGWEIYKSNGTLLYKFEDTSDNKIETLNTNIIAISKQNRIVFHNLNRFQEAEGFTLSSNLDSTINDNIASVKISFDSIFVLTKKGILKAYKNDKLNVMV